MTSIVKITKVNGKRPYFTRYIGRKVKGTEFTFDSIWCNPFRVEDFDSVHECCLMYEQYIIEQIKARPDIFNIEDLRGEILGCWCCNTKSYEPPYRCHGQILLKILHNTTKKVTNHTLHFY